MVLPHDEDGDGSEDFEAAFNRTYKSEFGFMLDTKNIIVDDIKVSPPPPPASYPFMRIFTMCYTGSWYWENI